MIYLLAAIVAVEGWKGPNTVGTYGEIGPYQITYDYWKDAEMPEGTFKDCEQVGYSQRVMHRYWKRYCPQALITKDYARLAAVHHFGPSGVPKPGRPVDTYVQQVMNLLNADSFKGN